MVEGSKGAYLAMWVPALAFAHLVALFFLIKTVLIADPSLPHRITKAVWRTPRNAVRRLFGGKGKAKGGKAHAEGGSAHETEQPIIHTSKPPIGAVAVGMPGDSTQLASAADNGSSPVSTSRTTSSNGPETSQPQVGVSRLGAVHTSGHTAASGPWYMQFLAHILTAPCRMAG